MRVATRAGELLGVDRAGALDGSRLVPEPRLGVLGSHPAHEVVEVGVDQSAELELLHGSEA